MKFIKPGYSFLHPTDSLLKNWKMALHDPLFLVFAAVIICISIFDIMVRYF